MSEHSTPTGGFNKPQNIHLPKVSAGQPLTQGDIQKINEAIGRVEIKSGSGIRVKQNAGGTTVEVVRNAGTINTVLPWTARWISDHRATTSGSEGGKALAIKVGKVYNGYYDFFQAESGSYLRAGIFTTSINGRGDNIWSIKHELEQSITFPDWAVKKGHWYLEGKQVTDSFGNKVRGYELKVQEDVTKLIPFGSLLLFSIVGTNKHIIQHANSDLFDISRPRRPFEVYRSFDTKKNKNVLKIETGAICGLVPTLGGDPIGEDNDGISGFESGLIYLKLTATGSGKGLKFPNAVTVEKGSTKPDDTKDACYIPIASVTTTSITQTVSGCLWAERLRWSDKTVYRFWRV